MLHWVQPDVAMRYAQQTKAYADKHEVHNLSSYSAVVIAWLRLRGGEWDEAERVTQGEIDKGITVTQLLAKTVLAELAVRRGDADAPDRLADVAAQANRTDELQRITPVLELATEYALLHDSPMPTATFAKIATEFVPRGRLTGWSALRVAAWAAIAGIEMPIDDDTSLLPYSAVVRHNWQTAADAFGAVGWMYDRALMLSMLEDESLAR